MASHKSLKRIIHRVFEELRATGEIARYTSVSGALNTFRAKVEIQRMNRNGFQEPLAVKNCLLKKHDTMLKYFEKRFENFLAEYDFDQTLPEDDPAMHDRIWICWWQGIDQAPDLVKQCVASIQRCAGTHTVTVLTEENYKEYVSIPAWIEEKFKAGIITRTNFSDLLRLSLLAEHGGMWLDSTFFCTAPVLDDYFQLPLWSIKRPDYLHASVACGYFAGYSLACHYENRWIFATIRDFFLNYWKEYDMLIDYLLIDYMITLARRQDSKIAEAFECIAPNNPRCDDLCIYLGEQYNEQLWQEIKKETALFKLTWKQGFSSEKDGMPTFYGKLLDASL